MKILVDHREVGYFYGGTENHIRELSKRMMLKNHSFIFLTEKGKKDPLSELKKEPSFQVKYLKSLKINRLNNFKRVSGKISKKIKRPFLTKLIRILSNLEWITKSGLWIFLNREKFDLIWVSKYTDSVLLRFLNKFKRIPYFESLEGYDVLESKEAKKSKFVFAISEFIQKKCEKEHGFKPKLITIGVDYSKFRNFNSKKVSEIKKKYFHGKKFILNVARLVESKDIKTFIKASKIILKKNKNILFAVCGEGEEKQNLNKLIKKLGLEKNFLIINAMGDELLDYYSSADLFVHVPIEGNHFGIVYLEAMACGLPIVASNKDASPSTVKNCALLIEPGNAKMMAESIEKLLKNKKLRKKLSKCSFERVKKNFNWKKIISEMEIFLKKVYNSESFNN